MVFPTIPTGGRIAQTSQANTTATRTGPLFSAVTHNAGDLIIAICVCYQAGATSGNFGTWSHSLIELADVGTSATPTMAIGVAYKWADGTESGAFTVVQTATVVGFSGMILMSIPAGTMHPVTAPAVTAIATGTPPDPASLTSGFGAVDTLWIAVAGNGETSAAGSWTGIASAPTNYGSFFNVAPADTSTIGQTDAAVAFRQLNAASEDVSTFTMDTSNTRGAALVIAVKPGIRDSDTGVGADSTGSVTANISDGDTGSGLDDGSGPGIKVAGTSAGNSGVTSSLNVSPALPSGWAAGDLLVAVIFNSFGAETSVSQTAGTGTWTLRSMQTSAGLAAGAVFTRIADGTETTPTFSFVGTSGQTCYATVALRPDADGSIISVDVWATDIGQPGTPTTSYTPNAATAAGTGEVSLIMATGIPSSNAIQTVTMTGPTNWTTLVSSGWTGNGTQWANFAGINIKKNVGGGSVAPGAATISASVSTNTTCAVWHLLVKETAPVLVSDGDSGSGTDSTGISVSGTSSGNNGATSGADVVTTLPSGWVAGDLLVAVIFDSDTGFTDVTQTAGTGTWTLHSVTSTGGSSAVFTRVADGTETAPTFSFVGPHGGQTAYAMTALHPDPGSIIQVDVWAADNGIPGSGTTSYTPNAATAAGTGEVSLIMATGFPTGSPIQTVSMTGPTGWDTLVSSGWGGDGTHFANFVGINIQKNVGDGSVTPGAATITGTVTANTRCAVYHLLVREVQPAITIISAPPFTTAPRWFPKAPGYPLGTPFDAYIYPYVSGVSAPVPVTDADTGVGADASVSITATLSSADTGTDIEASSITASLSSADTGVGTENTLYSIIILGAANAADAGTDTETTSIAATASSSDTGTGVENTVYSIKISGGANAADAGTDVEASSIAATASSSDTGTGIENTVYSVSILGAANAADAGTDVEASSIAATASSSDAGVGTENSVYSIIILGAANATDAGSGLDSGAVTAQAFSDADTGGDASGVNEVLSKLNVFDITRARQYAYPPGTGW